MWGDDDEVVEAWGLDDEEVAEVDAAAQMAATAAGGDKAPTVPQMLAGNYRKGHVVLNALDISIENPEGSVRYDLRNDPPKWKTLMKHHYGYLRGTVGADKDHIDVFVNPSIDLDFYGTVYVIDQLRHEGTFDETKVMLGFDSQEEAELAYLSNYQRGWRGMGPVTALSMDDFKDWVFNPAKSIWPASWRSNGGTEGFAGAWVEQPCSIPDLAEHEGPMPESEKSVLPQLRWTRDPGAQRMGSQLSGFPGGRGGEANAKTHSGARGQQRSLRAWEREVGDQEGASAEHAQKPAADARGPNSDAHRVGRGVRDGQDDIARTAGSRYPAGTGADDASPPSVFMTREQVEQLLEQQERRMFQQLGDLLAGFTRGRGAGV